MLLVQNALRRSLSVQCQNVHLQLDPCRGQNRIEEKLANSLRPPDCDGLQNEQPRSRARYWLIATPIGPEVAGSDRSPRASIERRRYARRCRVDDSEPLPVGRYSYVRRCARQRNRFIESPTLAIAEEYGDGLPENSPYITGFPGP